LANQLLIAPADDAIWSTNCKSKGKSVRHSGRRRLRAEEEKLEADEHVLRGVILCRAVADGGVV